MANLGVGVEDALAHDRCAVHWDVARARWRLVEVGERRAALARGAEVAARLERVGHVGGLEVVALLLLGLVAAVLAVGDVSATVRIHRRPAPHMRTRPGKVQVPSRHRWAHRRGPTSVADDLLDPKILASVGGVEAVPARRSRRLVLPLGRDGVLDVKGLAHIRTDMVDPRDLDVLTRILGAGAHRLAAKDAAVEDPVHRLVARLRAGREDGAGRLQGSPISCERACRPTGPGREREGDAAVDATYIADDGGGRGVLKLDRAGSGRVVELQDAAHRRQREEVHGRHDG